MAKTFNLDAALSYRSQNFIMGSAFLAGQSALPFEFPRFSAKLFKQCGLCALSFNSTCFARKTLIAGS